MTNSNVFFPVVERECVWLDRHGKHNETRKKALVAMTENKTPRLIGLVGEDYKLIHNQDVWDCIEPEIRGHDVTVRMYSDGNLEKTFFDVRYNDVKCLIRGSEISLRTIFWNGYGRSSLGCYAGAINAFCTNGMISGEYESSWKRHTSGLDVSIIQRWIERCVIKYEAQRRLWLKFDECPVQVENAQELFTRFDEPRVAEMCTLFVSKYTPQYGSTLWSAYNAMTDVATHFDKYKKRNVVSGTANSTMFSKLLKAEKIANEYYTELAA